MEKVRAKKHLGQHFLNDIDIAHNIVKYLKNESHIANVLEIGPGMGVLTDFLIKREDFELFLIELDSESVVYLNKKYPELTKNTIHGDFLALKLDEIFPEKTNQKLSIIGNFPYNISSQIFFKVLDYKELVEEVVCMLQKEVAVRIASKPGNKDYGILSVLLQAFYDIEYGFSVPPEAFDPPPKVNSGVIRLTRNREKTLNCDEKKFKLVVKTGFNQRRKKLSNALKPLGIEFQHPLLDKRAEALDFSEFAILTNLIFPEK